MQPSETTAVGASYLPHEFNAAANIGLADDNHHRQYENASYVQEKSTFVNQPQYSQAQQTTLPIVQLNSLCNNSVPYFH